MRYLLLLGVFGLTACNINYGEGERVGVVRKLSRKGILCKTWEGEALLAANNVMQPETWSFSIDDNGPVEAVREAMKSGKQVELLYTQYIATTPCAPDSGYRITTVK